MNNPSLAAAQIEREITDLIAAYPDLASDEEFRLDMIEGSTDALQFLDRLLTKEREAHFLGEAGRARRAEITKRIEADDRRKEAYRKLMFRIMAAANLRKVALAEATLSVRAVPASVLITDENAIPDQFWRQKRELDRASLAAELKAGHEVDGAMLGNGGETISVRVG